LSRVELREIAEDLEKFGMRRNAARLRAIADEDLPADERPCPMQDQGGQLRAIPWGLAEILYPVYAAAGHGSQSLETLAKRGGFGRGEIGMLAVGAYNSEQGRRATRGYERRMPILDLYEAARESAGPLPTEGAE
jgi:hypothetical protein